MKRMMASFIVILMICLILTGCSSRAIVGTWYSDRDDEAALILKKDGTYDDGKWLTRGNYTVDGETIILSSILDGQRKLTIQKVDGKKVLVYESGNYSHVYYESAKDATKAKEARQAAEEAAREAERAAAEEQAAKERYALQVALEGYWISIDTGITGYNAPVEFTSDGTYITVMIKMNGWRADTKRYLEA